MTIRTRQIFRLVREYTEPRRTRFTSFLSLCFVIMFAGLLWIGLLYWTAAWIAGRF